MSYRLYLSGAFIGALALLSYAGQADATRLMLNGASSLIILTQDEENSEVQNELDPQSDGGQPGGPSATAACRTGHAPRRNGLPPQGGGGSGATIEKELQEEKQ